MIKRIYVEIRYMEVNVSLIPPDISPLVIRPTLLNGAIVEHAAKLADLIQFAQLCTEVHSSSLVPLLTHKAQNLP